MSETQTTIETNTPEQVDERLRREAALAETARKQRADSAKAKREAAKPKAKPAPASKPVAKQSGSMAQFVDNLLLAGVKLTDLEAKAKVEAAKRQTKFGYTLGSLKSHIAYRSTQAKYKVTTDVKGVVKMVLVDKPKPAPKAKPAEAKKTGKAVGKRVTKQTNGGRQTVEPVAEPENVEAA
jgi:translation initiation factor IF-2